MYIPKANGKQRPLGIPTIRDRCLQAIVKNALEPCWEAQFEGTSYGFRPGRSAHDAIEKIYLALRPNKKKKWVVDADIKGCFDNINHEQLLSTIGNFPGRRLVREWLKAGYVDNNVFHSQSSGTPQGGIVSPPNKSKKWKKHKYWGRLNLQRKDNWVFGDKQSGNRMLKFNWTKIERHTLVTKGASPDNPALQEYWKKRNKKTQKSEAIKFSVKQEQVAYKQEYRCPICSQSLFNDESLHLHHIVPRNKGGKDTLNNLVWLHQFCHHKVHYQKVNTD